MLKYFVPFELAKALKEAGFEADLYPAWQFGDHSGQPHIEWRTSKGITETMIGLPFYDQVIDWFFTRHNIHFDNTLLQESWSCELADVTLKGWTRADGTKRGFPRSLWVDNREHPDRYGSLNAAIQTAIGLIKS